MLHFEHSYTLSWTLDIRETAAKYLESFEMWCWRRMELISLTGRLENEVVHRVKEESNILHKIKTGKVKWIGHILRRNCLLKCVIEGKIEGKIEGTVTRGRRRKQLQDDLKEVRRWRKLKEEALDHILWTTPFGRGFRPVVRETIRVFLCLCLSTHSYCKVVSTWIPEPAFDYLWQTNTYSKIYCLGFCILQGWSRNDDKSSRGANREIHKQGTWLRGS
jgi:hypothetical protein